MNIHLTGDGIELTEALRQFTAEKFLRLQRHYDHILDAHVVFNVEKMAQNAEATVHIPGGPIHAHSESTDLYSAIDTLVDRLDTQIRKHKEKMLDYRDHK
jgi:putative sigma-54 modulation protein